MKTINKNESNDVVQGAAKAKKSLSVDADSSVLFLIFSLITASLALQFVFFI